MNRKRKSNEIGFMLMPIPACFTGNGKRSASLTWLIAREKTAENALIKGIFGCLKR